MNGVSKTLYIPLRGKALVSEKGLILHDPKAQRIWENEGFPLHGKARSKWLAYYMAMRARVFDDWTASQLTAHPEALVLHLGCGLDDRRGRVHSRGRLWFDADLPAVMEERRKYYAEGGSYHLLPCDAARPDWVRGLPEAPGAIVVLEGLSMYLKSDELAALFSALREKFPEVHLLMDVYTPFAAKASKYKNPINTLGVSTVYGLDDPQRLARDTGLSFLKEWEMTPEALISQLSGVEQPIFRTVYAGKMAKKLYRLYEYSV